MKSLNCGAESGAKSGWSNLISPSITSRAAASRRLAAGTPASAASVSAQLRPPSPHRAPSPRRARIRPGSRAFSAPVSAATITSGTEAGRSIFKGLLRRLQPRRVIMRRGVSTKTRLR